MGQRSYALQFEDFMQNRTRFQEDPSVLQKFLIVKHGKQSTIKDTTGKSNTLAYKCLAHSMDRLLFKHFLYDRNCVRHRDMKKNRTWALPLQTCIQTYSKLTYKKQECHIRSIIADICLIVSYIAQFLYLSPGQAKVA